MVRLSGAQFEMMRDVYHPHHLRSSLFVIVTPGNMENDY